MNGDLLGEYYRGAIGEEIGKLRTIRRAISAWRVGTEKELTEFVKHYKEEHGPLPEEIADDLGHESSMAGETERAMYGSLAVSVASVAENMVSAMCKHLKVHPVDKHGNRIKQPDWGAWKNALENRLKAKFSDLDGFDENRLARLLGNCSKHEAGLVNKKLAIAFTRKEGAVIEYENEKWDGMIDGTEAFLLALASKL